MVNDFVSMINNLNQQQSNEQPQQNTSQSASSNYKTNKKSCKNRKSHTKGIYNVETDPLPRATAKSGISLLNHPKTVSKTVTHTKVKSGSWKRSEKSVVPINAFNANKKHKPLPKKSPNWLKFSNNKTRQDLNQPNNWIEQSSACRPGTLYSDVLFGAGCSNLVKIKNITPRNCSSTSANAQKKLTKALLFKNNGNHDSEMSDDSEINGNKNIFPALQNVKNKIYTPSLINNEKQIEKRTMSVEKISNNVRVDASKTSPTKNETYEEEADVVILSDLRELSLAENNTRLSYGDYLEERFQNLNGKIKTELGSSKEEQLLFSSISNIPKWNFMSVETGPSNAFPKFLCQFEDENYLKAEQMALLSLKLALGNYSPQSR